MCLGTTTCCHGNELPPYSLQPTTTDVASDPTPYIVATAYDDWSLRPTSSRAGMSSDRPSLRPTRRIRLRSRKGFPFPCSRKEKYAQGCRPRLGLDRSNLLAYANITSKVRPGRN